MLSTIPFSGFYHSFHEHNIDQVIESEFEYFACETGENMPTFLVDEMYKHAPYQAVQENYAQSYAESFREWLGLDGAFESMSSPREYNFTTDRIFVELTRSDVARMWKFTDREVFESLCRERFTSRDGFISGYSSDWRSWGKLSEWDHNQLGTLIHAFAQCEQQGEFGSYDEVELCENMLCNGDLDNWFCESDGYARAVNIAYYLRERAKRTIRTMEQWHAARRAENRPFETTPLGACMELAQ